MRRLKEKWEMLSPSVKILIITGLTAVVGIILRWRHVVDGLAKGFGYYSGYAD